MVSKEAKGCETVEEVYACIKELDEEKRLIRSSEDLDQLGK